MQEGGQNDYDDECDLLCLMAIEAAAQECAYKASCQREQVQYGFRDAPGSVFLALMFVIAIEEERYDAEAKEPAWVKRQPPPGEVQQEGCYPSRNKKEEEHRVTPLKWRSTHRLIPYYVRMLCAIIQNLHRSLCLSSCLSPRPASYIYHYNGQRMRV